MSNEEFPLADLPLGPLLRLEGLDYEFLPNRDSSIAIIRPFVENLLRESLNFLASVDTYDQFNESQRKACGWKPKGGVTYGGEKDIGGPGECVIELLEKSIPKAKLKAAVAPPVANNAANDNAAANNDARVRRSTNPTSETWACRRSFHDNEAVGGTASWREFVRYMKIEHVETEREMTPTVPTAQVAQNWVAATLIRHITLEENHLAGPKAWTRFTLRIVEMEHDLKQAGFNHRVFPVLQMTCRSVEEANNAQILVISVPINGWKGIAPPDPELAATKVADSPKITVGSYVSIERFRLVPGVKNRPPPLQKVSKIDTMNSKIGIQPEQKPFSYTIKMGRPPESKSSSNPDGPVEAQGRGPPLDPVVNQTTGEAENANPGTPPEEQILADNQPKQIEWVMATASHARGMLPLAIQTPFIPKKIAVDVPLFLKFMVGARQRESAAPANAAAEAQVEAEAAIDPAAYAQLESEAYALAFGLIDVGPQPAGNQPAANQPATNPQAEPSAGTGGEASA